MKGALLTQFFKQLADSTELFFALTSDQVRNHNGVDDLPAQRIDGWGTPVHGLGMR